nr:MAG TPA: hypothetical protein [Caudoviricetes sp.]
MRLEICLHDKKCNQNPDRAQVVQMSVLRQKIIDLRGYGKVPRIIFKLSGV